MGNVVEFKIMGLPKSSNTLLRRHWALVSKEKKMWHHFVLVNCMTYEAEPMTKARLTLTRYSSVEMDADNLAASFKFVVDGLVKAGVILDDKPSVIGQPQYFWKKTTPKNGHITVRVEEVL